MHGLVTLLDPLHSQEVESLWDMLAAECGLSGIRVTPFPHFSWLIGSDFDWDALENALGELAAQTRPFTVHAGGLGLFSGQSPVIYIPVVRSQELNHLHAAIWQRVQSIGKDISPYYAPACWTPHISLAYSDVTRQNLSCAMQKLAFQPIHWQIPVDNLTFIYEPDGCIGQIRYRYRITRARR